MIKREVFDRPAPVKIGAKPPRTLERWALRYLDVNEDFFTPMEGKNIQAMAISEGRVVETISTIAVGVMQPYPAEKITKVILLNGRHAE